MADLLNPFITVHAAFGYYVAECLYKAGETHTLDNGVVKDNLITISKTKSQESIWLIVAGSENHLDINSGAIKDTRGSGDSDLTKPYPVGTWKQEYLQDTHVFCLWKELSTPNHRNSNIDLTQINPFTLLDTQTTTIPNNTKLFLASGSLTINGQSYPGPQQIEIATGDKSATATGDCYGFIFP